MRVVFLALVSAVLAACATPGPPVSSSRVVVLTSSADVRRHDEYHYAPVVRAGSIVVVSGIPAAGAEDYEGKIRHMFEEAKHELAAGGATFADVVEILSFHASAKDSEGFGRDFAILSKIHAEYFAPPYPAWTAIGNAVLLSKDAPMEMRLLAVIGSGQGARIERKPPPEALPTN